MRIATMTLVVAASIAGAFAFTGAACAEPFMLTSASFKDGGMLQTKNAGNTKGNANCIGENVSPDLKWSNAPAGVKSFVLVASDWEGQGGLGSHHLVVYGIAPSVTGFAEGELSKSSDKFVGGKESSGTEMYRGPCPPAGTGMHHYLFNIIVTDLEPKELPAGLNRAELFDKLKGHAKGVAGIVALFGRN